jgi:hypothetical protein
VLLAVLEPSAAPSISGIDTPAQAIVLIVLLLLGVGLIFVNAKKRGPRDGDGP